MCTIHMITGSERIPARRPGVITSVTINTTIRPLIIITTVM